MVQEGRDAGRGGQSADGSSCYSTHVQAGRDLAGTGLRPEHELAGRPSSCLGAREELKEEEKATPLGAVALSPPSARSQTETPCQPVADPADAGRSLPDLGRVRPVLGQCSQAHSRPSADDKGWSGIAPQHLAEVDEGRYEIATSSPATSSEEDKRAAEEAAWQKSTMGKGTASLQVESHAGLPEGQGQEEALEELGWADSERSKPEPRQQHEEEKAQGEEANGRTEDAYRKRHPKGGRPCPLAAGAGCGAGNCPTGGSSAGHGSSTAGFGIRGAGGEGRKGVESGRTPPRPRPKRGMKCRSIHAIPTAVGHGGWPELTKVASGVLSSAPPNFHNVSVVGKPCPIECISSQQVACSNLSEGEDAQPHFARGTSYSSKIVSVQAELKLRDLKASLAMHLQLIRRKGVQVADVDLFCADVASLEGSIQAAKAIFAGLSSPRIGGDASSTVC